MIWKYCWDRQIQSNAVLRVPPFEAGASYQITFYHLTLTNSCCPIICVCVWGCTDHSSTRALSEQFGSDFKYFFFFCGGGGGSLTDTWMNTTKVLIRKKKNTALSDKSISQDKNIVVAQWFGGLTLAVVFFFSFSIASIAVPLGCLSTTHFDYFFFFQKKLMSVRREDQYHLHLCNKSDAKTRLLASHKICLAVPQSHLVSLRRADWADPCQLLPYLAILSPS